MLFDLHNDPNQEHPIRDERIEARMIRHMRELMENNDAPEEQFRRLGIRTG